MSQPRDDRQDDLFRPALEEIINLRHPLVRLAAEIDWGFLAGRFGSVCRAGPGQPPLPTRLVAGLFILKHMHNLSDEMLCDRWVENPYFQYFCGEVVFRHEAPFDRSSLTRWRQRLGEEQIAALLICRLFSVRLEMVYAEQIDQTKSRTARMPTSSSALGGNSNSCARDLAASSATFAARSRAMPQCKPQRFRMRKEE